MGVSAMSSGAMGQQVAALMSGHGHFTDATVIRSLGGSIKCRVLFTTNTNFLTHYLHVNYLVNYWYIFILDIPVLLLHAAMKFPSISC